jgi:hypothetical protein
VGSPSLRCPASGRFWPLCLPWCENEGWAQRDLNLERCQGDVSGGPITYPNESSLGLGDRGRPNAANPATGLAPGVYPARTPGSTAALRVKVTLSTGPGPGGFGLGSVQPAASIAAQSSAYCGRVRGVVTSTVRDCFIYLGCHVRSADSWTTPPRRPPSPVGPPPCRRPAPWLMRLGIQKVPRERDRFV